MSIINITMPNRPNRIGLKPNTRPAPVPQGDPLALIHPVPQSETPSDPGDPGEVLITRAITFRNSTFGALKSFQRQHEARTGVKLTNAAAVDVLLRERLAYVIKPSAVGEMLRLSRPGAAAALRGVQDKGEA